MSRLADLKAAADAAPYKPRPVDVMSWPTRGTLVLAAIVALVVLGFSGFRVYQSIWPAFGLDDTVVLAMPNDTRGHIPVALHQEDCEILLAHVRTRDWQKVRAMFEARRVFNAKRGSRCKVSGSVGNIRKLEFSGDDADSARGWVPYEWLKPPD